MNIISRHCAISNSITEVVKTRVDVTLPHYFGDHIKSYIKSWQWDHLHQGQTNNPV